MELNTCLDFKVVRLQHAQTIADTNQELDRIVRFIGKHYGNVTPLLKACKQAMNASGQVSLALAGVHSDMVRDCCQLARDLEANALISGYTYDRPRRILSMTVPLHGNASRFLTGGWFERHTHQVLEHYFTSHGVVAHIYPNVHVATGTREIHEIDLLLSVQGHPLLIECTTGSCADHVTRLDKKRRLLGLSKSQAILVSAQSTDAYVEAQNRTTPVTFTNMKHFLEYVDQILAPSLCSIGVSRIAA